MCRITKRRIGTLLTGLLMELVMICIFAAPACILQAYVETQSVASPGSPRLNDMSRADDQAFSPL